MSTLLIGKSERMRFTAIIERSEDGWYVGQIEEIPEAMSQGKDLEELRGNLRDALRTVLETNKEVTDKEYEGKDVIREEFDAS